MSEQHYRVIADRDKGDASLSFRDVEVGDRLTATWTTSGSRLDRIERPVPTADEMMSEFGIREHIGPDSSNYTVPSPHPPTREQIADELIERLDPHVSHALSEDQLDAIAEAVRGMMRPEEEASTARSPYHCMSEDAHTAHTWAGSWCPGTEAPALIKNGADR